MPDLFALLPCSGYPLDLAIMATSNATASAWDMDGRRDRAVTPTLASHTVAEIASP
jgi:hypothetical protein